MPTSKCLCESSEDSVLNSSGVKLPRELAMSNLPLLPLDVEFGRHHNGKQKKCAKSDHSVCESKENNRNAFRSGNSPDSAHPSNSHSSIHQQKELQRAIVLIPVVRMTSREEQPFEPWQTLYLRFVHTFLSTPFSISSTSC